MDAGVAAHANSDTPHNKYSMRSPLVLYTMEYLCMHGIIDIIGHNYNRKFLLSMIIASFTGLIDSAAWDRG